MIVFNEREYAETLENEEIKNSREAIKKGAILAKLYLDRGLSDEEIIRKLNEKFTVLNNSYNYDIKHFKINKMLKQAKINPKFNDKTIYFSKEELDFIHSIDNIITEKVFFILLCMSKFCNNNFYFRESDVIRLAKISSDGGKQRLVFQKLIQNKYFEIREQSLLSNKKMKMIFYSATPEILALYNPDNIVLEINNYRNLVYYYLNYINYGVFIKCKRCGTLEKCKNKWSHRKYCEECIAKSSKIKVSKGDLQKSK